MDPDAFSLKPARGEIESYADAVLFGYRSMDTLMRRFFAWAEADTTIILSSALTPAALLKARGEGWTAFLSIAPSAFSSSAQYHARMVEPVMPANIVFGSRMTFVTETLHQQRPSSAGISAAGSSTIILSHTITAIFRSVSVVLV